LGKSLIFIIITALANGAVARCGHKPNSLIRNRSRLQGAGFFIDFDLAKAGS